MTYKRISQKFDEVGIIVFKNGFKIIGLCFWLSGCAVGPDFARPNTAADQYDRFHNAFEQRIGSSADMSLWWERLNDPLLNDYADKLLRQNLSLQQAGERIYQARTQVTSARSSWGPQISGSASGARSLTPSNGSTLTDRVFSNSYDASLSASWELDLFGRIARSVEAAKASYEAAQYDYEALTHSLMAQLVNTRVSIAVNKTLLDLAQKNYINRKKIYKLIKQRYELGVRGTVLSDVYLAEDSYRQVYAEVYRFERQLMDDIYRLDILLGEAPGSNEPLSKDFRLVVPPMDVAACIPARLLDRRPDIKAAELRSKAANAEIGVAIGDLYPSINLGATYGFSSTSTGNLFSASQLAGSLLGSLTQRIFEGGRLRANIDLQESQARELMLSYKDSILNALYEVETRLKSDRDLTNELQSLEKSIAALNQAEALSKERYLKGILSLQEFLEIQQRRYTTEQNLHSKRQEKWTTRTALYLALGGDWFDTNENNKSQKCL